MKVKTVLMAILVGVAALDVAAPALAKDGDKLVRGTCTRRVRPSSS